METVLCFKVHQHVYVIVPMPSIDTSMWSKALRQLSLEDSNPGGPMGSTSDCRSFFPFKRKREICRRLSRKVSKRNRTWRMNFTLTALNPLDRVVGGPSRGLQLHWALCGSLVGWEAPCEKCSETRIYFVSRQLVSPTDVSTLVSWARMIQVGRFSSSWCSWCVLLLGWPLFLLLSVATLFKQAQIWWAFHSS